MSTETTEETIGEEKELALDERGDPSRTHPAEHVFRFHHHLVSAARKPADLQRYEYWSRHTRTLRARDLILCEPRDMSWALVLRVLEVGGDGVVVQSWGGKETLAYEPPPPKKRGPLGTNDEDYQVLRSEEFPDRWAVVRSDGQVMTRGLPFTREQCLAWLSQHLKTVQRP
jgi:hypothetical protein